MTHCWGFSPYFIPNLGPQDQVIKQTPAPAPQLSHNSRLPSSNTDTKIDAAAKVLTPVKGVDPIVNETFKRMSFQVADHQGSVGENLIGDSNTNLMFSKASPSFINKLSSKDVEIPAPASKKGSDTQAYPPNTVKKENEPPTSKSYLPPHLRGTQSSVKHSNSSTGAPAQATSSLKGLLPETMSKVTDPSPVKSTVSEVELTDKTTSGGAKSPTHASSATEDLEHKIFFNAWPKLEDRARPGTFPHKFPFQWLLIGKQPPKYARSLLKISLVARQLPS